MTLNGTVRSIPNGAHGFDANSVISAAQAAQAKQQGFTFAVRYLSRTTPQNRGDLTPNEAATILTAGLGLMPVQHVAGEGWSPNQALGAQYGAAAATNTTAIGFPAGVNVWLDLEGVNQAATAQDVIAYCNAWSQAVSASGFVPGIYVGANAILSGAQLYWNLRFAHYWQSGSTVPDIPHRGYQLFQSIVAGDAPFGVAIDRDVAKTDALGGNALMLIV